MSTTRADRAEGLEEWAGRVDAADLTVADTETLRTIVELVEQRNGVDEALTVAVHSARQEHRSWSEIGAMLGVSKQAAQRKYASSGSA